MSRLRYLGVLIPRNSDRYSGPLPDWRYTEEEEDLDKGIYGAPLREDEYNLILKNRRGKSKKKWQYIIFFG